MTSVANISGMSKSEPRARLTSTPRPRSAPAHSPTIAPTTASVTPTRNPPRIDGSAAGTSSVVSTWRRVARNERAISSSPASTDRIPTIVETAIGKNTIRAQMTTLLVRPGPNHSASSGARARIGVAWAATMYGETIRSTSARPGEPVAGDEADDGPDEQARGRSRRASTRRAARSRHQPSRGRTGDATDSGGGRMNGG